MGLFDPILSLLWLLSILDPQIKYLLLPDISFPSVSQTLW